MRIAKLAISLFLLSVIVACATAQTEDHLRQAESLYEIGVAYLNENEIQKAFVEFQKSYRINPRDKRVLNAIGIIYLLHFNEIDKAVGYFESAVREDPFFSEAYNNLAFAHEKLENFKTAISYAKKAISDLTYATPQKAYIIMGNSYYRLGRYELALNSFREAVRRAPGLGIPYMRLALCYNAIGQYGEAFAALTRAIQLDPIYKGNLGKAREDLEDRRLRTSGYELQDIRDFLEILKY
jgi:tetratricopeptide (TPR) repeat protein